MQTQNVDVGEAVRLIDRMTALTNEKLKLLIELRASVLHHFHADPNDFPRPMGVKCLASLHPGTERLPIAYCIRSHGHSGSHQWSKRHA